jgi:hypothetical protein
MNNWKNDIRNKQIFYPKLYGTFGKNHRFLGRFTDSKGYKYDLGIFANDRPSFAIVCQYEDMYEPQHISGDISDFERSGNKECMDYEVYLETFKRAKILNII